MSGLRILVPVKRVIDYAVKPRVNKAQTGVETNVKHSMNPFDELSIEEAVRMRERKLPVEDILAFSAGPAKSQDILRTAMAMGADRGIHVVEEKTDLEPLSVAKLLQKVVEEEKRNLVILGKQSIDDDANQTGQMLAGLLNWPQATQASKVEIDGESVTVTREVDGGVETLKAKLPMIITTDLRLNEPRYASLPNIMKAKKKPLEKKTLGDYGLDGEKRLKTVKVEEPKARQGGGKVEDVDGMIAKLKELGAFVSGQLSDQGSSLPTAIQLRTKGLYSNCDAPPSVLVGLPLRFQVHVKVQEQSQHGKSTKGSPEESAFDFSLLDLWNSLFLSSLPTTTDLATHGDKTCAKPRSSYNTTQDIDSHYIRTKDCSKVEKKRAMDSPEIRKPSVMEGIAELTDTQRTVLESLKVGSLLLVVHPIPDEPEEEQEDEEDESDEEDEVYDEDDDDESGRESDAEDTDANSVVTVLGPADVPLPATSEEENENLAGEDEDEDMQSVATDESDDGSAEEDDADNDTPVSIPVPPQVYVVAALTKDSAGALTSVVLTPMTHSLVKDPANTHTFRIFGKKKYHGHTADCTTCPAPLDLTTLTSTTELTSKPSGDTIRALFTADFPTVPHYCHAACTRGFLPTPAHLSGLFTSYHPPLLTYLTTAGIPLTSPLPATLQPIICPVCMGVDLLKQQQILHTTMLMTSYVDMTDVMTFLTALNPRRTSMGLPFLQFDEREWGYLFPDMESDEEGEDEDGQTAAPAAAGGAGAGRWQTWTEAMDPNAIITTSALPAELVAKLSRVLFKDTDRAKDAVEGEVVRCRICLDGIKAEAKVVVLPCGHSDCEECLVEWLRCRDSCHACRRKVIVEVEAEVEKSLEGGGQATSGEDDGKGKEVVVGAQEVAVDRDGDVEMLDAAEDNAGEDDASEYGAAADEEANFTSDEDDSSANNEDEDQDSTELSDEQLGELVAAAARAESYLRENPE
ncbi:unnamed protein product [Zymoseptoria tritici ST99CH_3D1]|nr:unnamed protein product [Zymoseptoria tritici ST99CH_3D1]